MTDIAVPEFYKYIHNDSEFFMSGWLSSDYETVPSLGHTGGNGTFHVFSMNKFDIVSDSDLLQFSIEHIWGPLYDVNWTVSNNQTEDDILITAYIKNTSGITMREMKLSVRGNYVELTCSLMGDTKSLVLENGFLNLFGDDFVDVNGVNYPIKGNGTPIFTVKVPISDSYVVSYPADAVTLYSDGGHFVHYPNTYEGQGYGVYIGKIQDPEYNTCYLKAMHGMLQLKILNIEDWKHIALRSNDGTAICGDAVLDSDHNILYVNNGSDEITFVRENSDDPNAYLPVLPCTLSGLTITIYKSDDTQIVKTYSNTLNIRSGYLISIGL
jgi:hypothetical protein